MADPMPVGPTRYLRDRTGRLRYLPVGLTAAGLVLVASAVFVAVRPSSGPDRGFTATVTGCDVRSPGTAQVGYSVTNEDRTTHAYRVLVTVTRGSTPLGWGVSLVNHLRAGATGTAQVPITVTGAATGASCSVHAEVFDGSTGHHDHTRN